MNHSFILILLFVVSCLHGEHFEKSPYKRPYTCSVEIWSAMQPYFLPINHPIKVKLDKIFSQNRVVASVRNLKKAGFIGPFSKSVTNAYVMKHPRIPGYIFKCYLDTQNIEDWFRLHRRIMGAQLVQASLDKYAWNHLIKVPKKWIYPLPEIPPPKFENGITPKNFILIAQDEGLLSREGNIYAWKHSMTRELLTALYIVLSENCMTDSIRISNIPFCHDGKIAFIDTEFFNVPDGNVRYWKLFDYLSTEMANYLKGLAENGAPW